MYCGLQSMTADQIKQDFTSNSEHFSFVEKPANIDFDQRYAPQRKDWIKRWAFVTEEEDTKSQPMMHITGGDRYFPRIAQMATIGLYIPDVDIPISDINMNPNVINNEPQLSDIEYSSIDDLPDLIDDIEYLYIDDLPDLVDDIFDSQSTWRDMITSG